MSTTGARKEALERVPYIHYPVQLKKNKAPVQALIDSECEVNVIYLSFAKQLGLPIWATDVGAQKIDGIILDIYGIVVATFLIVDKTNRVRSFEESFLVAIVSPEVVLRMLFLTLSDANVNFSGRDLRWRTYTTKEALSTTKRVELVGKKEFVTAALDPKHETLIVDVASLSSTPLVVSFNVHPFRRP